MTYATASCLSTLNSFLHNFGLTLFDSSLFVLYYMFNKSVYFDK